jgi:hypothetical protein
MPGSWIMKRSIGLALVPAMAMPVTIRPRTLTTVDA